MKYHTGYYLTFSNKEFTADDYSKVLIKDSRFSLLKSNYMGKDWHIEWIFNNKWKGLEFIINANSFETAQNVLFNVLCSAIVINGVLMNNNEAHYPHILGTIENIKGIDILNKPINGYSDCWIPSFFYLAKLSSYDNGLTNAIVKHHLSTEIYSHSFMDINEIIDWKKISILFK